MQSPANATHAQTSFIRVIFFTNACSLHMMTKDAIAYVLS